MALELVAEYLMHPDNAASLRLNNTLQYTVYTLTNIAAATLAALHKHLRMVNRQFANDSLIHFQVLPPISSPGRARSFAHDDLAKFLCQFPREMTLRLDVA